MRYAVAVLSLFVACSATAETLTIGRMPTDTNSSASITSGAPVSFVNFADRATTAGTITRASVTWTGTCNNAFKLVFLRPTGGLSVAVVAQRGPFNAVGGRNDFAITPPVDVNQYDVLAVVQLQPASACGSVNMSSVPYGHATTFITAVDVSSGTLSSTNSNLYGGGTPAMVAYGADPALVRVLPVVGAAQGATAFFRTAVQLLNPTFTTITGKFVFHPAGHSASATDPELAFSVQPRQTISYPDVVTAMSTTGLGSLDIMTNGAAPPLVTSRVFSDGGSTGTSGFYEEAVTPQDTLDIFSRGLLAIPTDLTNFRLNVGVRTLDFGATVTIVAHDSTGTVRGSRTQVFPPNYFVQGTAADFSGATTLPPGGYLEVVMSAGTAIVYGSTVDNRTSDSALAYALVR